MLLAIRHGLGNLANCHGRDARQAFWYYVLFIYIVTTAISLVVTLPMTMQAMMAGIQQGMAQAEHGDPAASEAAIQATVMGSMSQSMQLIVWTSLATALLMLLGLAASFVRRLHDSGLSGWWAVIPAGLQAFSITTVPSQMNTVEASMQASMAGDPLASISAMQGMFGAGPLAAWGAIIVVVVLGVRKSTDGPNQYGEAPFVA
ncbi:MAG: DUF805 domain-containing protein [Novosphingobium sp.]|nr:DUF805 domain-containing protein [Novosphingobium sp.]